MLQDATDAPQQTALETLQWLKYKLQLTVSGISSCRDFLTVQGKGCYEMNDFCKRSYPYLMHGLLSKKLLNFKERTKQRGNPASLLIELEVMEV